MLDFFKKNKNHKTRNNKIIISSDILDCYWDFEINPISFDIMWMLSAATLYAKNNGFNSIRINFIPEKNQETRDYPKNYLEVISRENLEWRKRNICYSAPYLYPMVKYIKHWENRDNLESIWKNSLITKGEIGYHWLYYKYINQKYNNFRHSLNISKSAKNYIKKWSEELGVSIENSLVITLREYGVDIIRNNDLEELANFIEVIKDDFTSIIIVRDTDRGEINNYYKKFIVCEIASVNIELRAALYEIAKLNITVSSGPASLLQLNSNTNFIISNFIHEDIAPAKKEFMIMKGFDLTITPNFLNINQKWIWEKDSYENLIKAYRELKWE